MAKPEKKPKTTEEPKKEEAPKEGKKSKAPKGGSAIKGCLCQHAGQDGLHGPGRRVHNFAPKKGQWRCSVCGALR